MGTLTSPAAWLAAARTEDWAVGGFNVFNLESARAVATAAEQTRAPVMLQTSSGAVEHAGLEAFVAIARLLASQSTVPLALHLDHGKDPAMARAAVEAGYTSVMIDASHLPLEENIRETRRIVEFAHARGVYVEAELGQISGIEDLKDVEVEETLTVPAEAARFAAETGVDALAIAIGTSHGATKFSGEPRLDFERLQAIGAVVDLPLVLHGASAVDPDAVALAERHGAQLLAARGIPHEFVRRAIGLGIAKVNTDSDLRLAALGRLREVLGERPSLFNLYQLMGEMEAAIEAATVARIEMLGSAGHAG